MSESIEDYRAGIEAALVYAGGTHTFDDIVAGVAAGDYQFWPGPSSVVITEIVEYPRLRALNFFLAGGGNLAELEAMTPHILEWGRTQGCTRALFTGRRGWTRTFLTRTGWVNSQLETLSKEL